MANSATNVAAGKPKIGGAIYAAPKGTTLPTDATTALASAFKNLGYVSEDGLTNNATRDGETIKAWGGDSVLYAQNGIEDTFTFTLIEVLNEDVLKFVYGSSNVSGSLSTGLTVKVNAAEIPECILVVEIVLRGAVKRIVIPSAQVSEVGEIAYTDSDAVGYETTVIAIPDGSGNSHYEYIKSATTPAPDPDPEDP